MREVDPYREVFDAFAVRYGQRGSNITWTIWNSNGYISRWVIVITRFSSKCGNGKMIDTNCSSPRRQIHNYIISACLLSCQKKCFGIRSYGSGIITDQG